MNRNSTRNSQRRGRSHSHDVKIGPATRRKRSRNRSKIVSKNAYAKEMVQRFGLSRSGY
jgi:hypothetical protein